MGALLLGVTFDLCHIDRGGMAGTVWLEERLSVCEGGFDPPSGLCGCGIGIVCGLLVVGQNLLESEEQDGGVFWQLWEMGRGRTRLTFSNQITD